MAGGVRVVDAVTYSEETAAEHVRGIPLSHLSVETGHFYMEDFDGDEAVVHERIAGQFRRVAPLVTAARAMAVSGTSSPRVSTCFLIDDYFSPTVSPAKVIGAIQRVAGDCGLSIDYMVREAGCAIADNVPLAELTAGQLMPEPTPGTNGARPSAIESGWLCNGERSAEPGTTLAMHPVAWKPPVELAKHQHSVFMDVEMWNERVDRVRGELVAQRTWSCPFLAAVWHLLRLGMLRNLGEPVAVPQLWETGADWPEHWDDLPAVVQLRPKAPPFAAYRSLSILPQKYLSIENASRVILEHLQLDSTVTDQLMERAAREGVDVPHLITGRMSHFLIEGS